MPSLGLLSLLPRLLPSAIAWAEVQSHHVAQTGQSLDLAGLALARRVGVQRPELIRMKLVGQIRLPTDPILQQAAIQTGLLGPETVGLTLGHSIFITQGNLTPRVLSHECRHVYQYELGGSIAAFLPVYLQQIASVCYYDAPLEQDARANERDTA
ncbi:MAG: hypothetical protein DMG35_09355 [Acidobacteria bacterium]|nr:MAG: hypothetical protein DMG35_09355 [Acidobacteriota bacterium]